MTGSADGGVVRAVVECGDELHTVSYADGALSLDDHDLERERVLQALSGQPPLCLQILDAWNEVSLERLGSAEAAALLIPGAVSDRQVEPLIRSARARAAGGVRRWVQQAHTAQKGQPATPVPDDTEVASWEHSAESSSCS